MKRKKMFVVASICFLVNAVALDGMALGDDATGRPEPTEFLQAGVQQVCAGNGEQPHATEKMQVMQVPLRQQGRIREHLGACLRRNAKTGQQAGQA